MWREVLPCGDLEGRRRPPEYEGLLGFPPIVSEMFTVQEQEGQLAMYFTREGASLKELRKQALEDNGLANP